MAERASCCPELRIECVIGAEGRRKEDRKLVLRMTERIRELFPGYPPQELAAITEQTAQRVVGEWAGLRLRAIWRTNL
jgi:hypothetical protein